MNNRKLLKSEENFELDNLSMDIGAINNLLNSEPGLVLHMLTKLDTARTPHPEFTLERIKR